MKLPLLPEIKELAKQTIEATEGIRKKIEPLQSSADPTVSTIQEIRFGAHDPLSSLLPQGGQAKTTKNRSRAPHSHQTRLGSAKSNFTRSQT